MSDYERNDGLASAGQYSSTSGTNNSINIEENSVQSVINTIDGLVDDLSRAHQAAKLAIEKAINAFDDADSNKKDLKLVLDTDSEDIEKSIATIKSANENLRQANKIWSTTRDNISEAIRKALEAAKQKQSNKSE